MTFTVTRTGDLTSASSVDWALAHGTTTAADFTGATSGTVTFAAGASTATITLNVVGDTAFEPNETFTIGLSNATGATITDNSGAGTIANDDALPTLPTLAIGDATVLEGNGGTASPTAMTFTVTRTGDLTSASSVDWALAHGTTTAADFTGATNGTVTFAAGASTATITLNVVGDTAFEPNETFTIGLSNATGATITDNSGAGTITNDDAVPVNTAPTAPSGTASVNEDAMNDTPVLTLAATDVDGQTIDYTFATGGTTSADGKFKIVGNVIKVNGTLADVPADAAVTYAIVANDGSGATNATAIGNVVITVKDVTNHAPTGLSLSNASVLEYAAVGAEIGTLNASDPNGDALTYKLLDNTGGGRFAIVGNKLVLAGPGR